MERRDSLSLGILILCCLVAGGLSPAFIAHFHAGGAENRHLWIAGVMTLILGLYIAVHRGLSAGSWLQPFLIGAGIYVSYCVAGIAMYQLRELYWFNYPSDMQTASQAALIGLLALFAGKAWRFPSREKSGVPGVKAHLLFDIRRLDRMTWIFVIVGNIAAAILFDFYTDISRIPLFAFDKDMARIALTQYSPGKGTLWVLLILLILAAPLSYWVFIVRGSRLLMTESAIFLLRVTLCIVPLSMYAGRFYFLMPVVLTIIVHALLKGISIKSALMAGGLLFSTAMAFIVLRTYAPYGGGDAHIRVLWADIFPEMRNFGMTVDVAGSPGIMGEMISNVLAGWLPSAFFELAGVHKTDFLFSIGEYVTMHSASGLRDLAVGTRTGLLGEMYLGAGYPGVFVAFFFLGLIWGKLGELIRALSHNDARHFAFWAITMFLAMTLIYGTNMVVTSGFSLPFIGLIMMFATRSLNDKPHGRSASGALPPRAVTDMQGDEDAPHFLDTFDPSEL